MQCCLANPVAFYALAYASGQHMAHVRNTRNDRSPFNLLLLSYKTQAVRLINEALTKLDGNPIPDAVLIAILSLGAHGNGRKRTPLKAAPPNGLNFDTLSSPDDPIPAMCLGSIPNLDLSLNPLSRAQMLHFYGGIDQEAAHMSAIRTLMKHNKGTASIELPGLKGAIELGDLLNSTILHIPPCIPAPHPMTAALDQYLPNPTGEGSTPRLLHLPVDALPDTRASLALVSAFTTARAVGLGVEAHVAAVTKDYSLPLRSSPGPNPTHSNIHEESSPPPKPPTLTDLIISRNAAHYALLSLPAANPQWSESFARYEAARVASLIFANFVLFPLPEATGVNVRYSRMLRRAMEGLGGFLGATYSGERRTMNKGQGIAGGDSEGEENRDEANGVDAELVFWCAAMGALAAQGGGERAWFLAQWKGSARRLEMENWSTARAVLERWLWWEYLFGVVGQVMWDAAIASAEG
jgi:hypothetical protein